MNIVSAEFVRLFFLAVARGEGMNLTTPLIGKLQRHMAKSTYSDDAYAGGGRYLVNEERREHGNPTAKQWARHRHVQGFGDRPDPGPLGPHSVSEASVTTYYSALCVWAKVLITGQTLMAGKAAVCPPSQSNALTDFKSFCLVP
jgi:hypothetical protein